MPIRMPETRYDLVPLKGGWDQVTPTLSLKAGVARDCINFECSTVGGYSRIGGYERYDGRAKPSDAVTQVIQVTAFTNTPTVGQTLTGNTSGATGTIVAVDTTRKYVVLTQITGAFTSTEVVKVGATTIGTATTFSASITAKEYAVYRAAAADVYRALISKVPGSGPVRGVVGATFGGVDTVYAFRDNVAATSTDLYVASASGWTKINYKNEISFTAGGASAPADGATLTQGGVTATVRRVMDSSGSWAGSTAAGRLIIDNPAGGNFAAGAATLTGGVTVTLSGVQTAITVSPGGTFEFASGNFTGAVTTVRIYGCDGVNRGFEFDGTTYAPVTTGASPDTPKHCEVHKAQMVWAIQSSMIISGPGTPYRYSTTDSGAQIAVGDTITGFLIQPGAQTTAALAVFGLSSTFMLYGTGLSTWNLVPYNTGTGGAHYTAQNLSQSYILDHQGVVGLATSLAYGNFTQATVTVGIKSFINDKRSRASASTLRRDSSQYRLFFSDGYGLYVTIVNGKLIGAMPVYFPTPVFCAWEGTLTTNNEVSFFGGTDGYVYQMDSGSSFDGVSIEAYVTLNWNAMGSPRVLKRYRHASIEMQGNYYAEVGFGYQLGYGTSELGQPAAVTYASSFQLAPAWDSFVWDAFTWDGRTLFPTEVDINGTAENIQITLSCTGNYIYPFNVNSIITHYSLRRGMR